VLAKRGHLVQVMEQLQNNKQGDEKRFIGTHGRVRRGDIIGVSGYPTRTWRGELSVASTWLEILTPCLHMQPTAHFGLKDPETRFRMRCLDLIMGRRARRRFELRANVIREERLHGPFRRITLPLHGDASAHFA
jgi:lysyl-tRNA synthetase class 2